MQWQSSTGEPIYWHWLNHLINQKSNILMGSKSKKAKRNKKKVQRGASISGPLSIFKNRDLLLPIVIVLGLTFLIFSPSLQNEFVNWDDDVNLLENENVQGLSAHHIKKIFTDDVIGNYNPLPILTFAIEYSFVEFEPFLYHFNNLLLHLICVFLVYKLSLMLGLSTRAAFVVALLFGIHPMRVESVAWVTERKDVLFSTFFFAALIHYVNYLDHGRRKSDLAFIYLFFILSLFSKIQAVALPLAMLAIDYWKNRPIAWKLIIEKLPYFALSMFFGLLGVYMLSENQSLDQAKADFSLFQRLFIGSYSYVVYWYKALFPYPMSPLYPYPSKLPLHMYLSMIPALGIVAMIWVGFKKSWKGWVFGSLFFTFNIVFLLQILGAGQGFLADRFTYVAYFGLFFSAAYYLEKYFFSSDKYKTAAFSSLGILFLIYGIVTFQQTKIWENGDTLWTHVLKYYTKVDTPYRNRGNFHRDRGDYQRAMKDYQTLVQIDSTNGSVYNSIGKVYFEQENWPLALENYRKAVKFSPEKGEFWVNKAATLASMGDFQSALKDVTTGIENDPDHTNGYQTRFLILQYLGDYESSIADLKTLIEFRPKEAALRYEVGRAYMVLNRPQEALPYFNQAISLDGSVGLFYRERGKAHLSTGNKAGAQSDFNRAQQLGETVDPSLLNQVR